MENKKLKIIGTILGFPVLKIIIGIVSINVGIFLLRNLSQSVLSYLNITNDIIQLTIIFVIRIFALYYIYKFFIWIYEKRKPFEITFTKSTLKQIFFGAIIGLLCISLIVIINWVFGWITIERVNESPDILNGIYHTIFYSLLQDVVYYLILFRIVEKYLGTYITILLTATIFSFKHLLFPEYSFISGIFLFINITFIFSSLYIRSRTIWEIFGFHFTYNFIQSIIFGNFSIEGIQCVINLNMDGPVLFTGNPSGFETSIFCVLYCVVVGGYILYIGKKQTKFVKPFWIKQNNNAP